MLLELLRRAGRGVTSQSLVGTIEALGKVDLGGYTQAGPINTTESPVAFYWNFAATYVTGNHTFKVDEPEALGGTDLAANPVQLILASLGACQAITYQVWAAKLGIAHPDSAVRHPARPRVIVALSGARRRLNVHCPVLDIVSTTDRIVPAATAVRVGERLELGLGHVGMVVGSRAPQTLWEALAGWLSRTAANC